MAVTIIRQVTEVFRADITNSPIQLLKDAIDKAAEFIPDNVYTEVSKGKMYVVFTRLQTDEEYADSIIESLTEEQKAALKLKYNIEP